MDADLRKYNTMNANLGFMVDDLRGRQDNKIRDADVNIVTETN